MKKLVWVVIAFFVFVLFYACQHEDHPAARSAATETQHTGLTPQQAAELVTAAKVQLRNKAYVAAQSMLNSVTQRTPATSSESVEAATLLKKIGPLAAQQAQRKQQAEELQQEYRNGARATLEEQLLQAGYDVQVGFVGKQGEMSTNLLIMGQPVSRVFIHQLIGPGLRRSLRRDGFTKITFMKSQWDWVGEYDVATDTISDSP